MENKSGLLEIFREKFLPSVMFDSDGNRNVAFNEVDYPLNVIEDKIFNAETDLEGVESFERLVTLLKEKQIITDDTAYELSVDLEEFKKSQGLDLDYEKTLNAVNNNREGFDRMVESKGIDAQDALDGVKQKTEDTIQESTTVHEALDATPAMNEKTQAILDLFDQNNITYTLVGATGDGSLDVDFIIDDPVNMQRAKQLLLEHPELGLDSLNLEKHGPNIITVEVDEISR